MGSAFDIETGEPLSGGSDGFSGVFGQVLCDFARDDQRICAITAAMKIGTGLSGVFSSLPGTLFDVGIAEGTRRNLCRRIGGWRYASVFAVYSTFCREAMIRLSMTPLCSI